MSGNVKLALSHVVPDLVLKVLKGQDPLHILGDGIQVRHYTYGGDLAHGIRLAMESPARHRRGLQPLDRRVDHRPRAGRGHLAQGPRRGPAVPPRSATRRSSTTSSCASPTSARPASVLGLRGDHHARRDARRGHPVDPRRRPRPAGCDRLPADELYEARFDEREVEPEGRASGARSSRTSERFIDPDAAGPRPCLRPRPFHPAREAPGSAGRPTSGTSRASLPPDVHFVQASGLELAKVLPTGHFGTVFMSNYLEHLESGEAVIEQLRVAQALLSARRPRRRSCSRTSASSVRATGTSSTTAWPSPSAACSRPPRSPGSARSSS